MKRHLNVQCAILTKYVKFGPLFQNAIALDQ